MLEKSKMCILKIGIIMQNDTHNNKPRINRTVTITVQFSRTAFKVFRNSLSRCSTEGPLFTKEPNSGFEARKSN